MVQTLDCSLNVYKKFDTTIFVIFKRFIFPNQGKIKFLSYFIYLFT